jgi:flagellar biosynthesis/type III secretory pathway protein FliH
MQERLVRLPARLRGVLRSDPAAPANVTPHHDSPNPAIVRERQAIEDVLKSLRDTIAGLNAQHHARLKSLQKVAIDLAIAVAERFLHQRLTDGSFPIEALVRQAVAHLEPRQPVNVALHPDDLVLFEKRLAADPQLALDSDEVQFSADATVRRGGCMVRSGEIMTTTNLDEKLSELHAQLLQSIESAHDMQTA